MRSEMRAGELSLPPPSRSGDEAEFERFFRWGWLPLAAGTFVLCVLAVLVTDVWLFRDVAVSDDARAAYALRALLLSLIVAAWAGGFVHLSRRRIEAARESLLLERAAVAEQRRRMEQTQGVAAILRVMAHELRNPLNTVRLHAEVIDRTLEAGEIAAARADLGELDAEVRRMSGLIDEYVALAHAAQRDVRLQTLDLREPIREAVRAHRPAFERLGIQLSLQLPETPLPVEGDPNKLVEIVHKLLRNASEVLDSRDEVKIRLARHDSGACAVIEIIDTGPGFVDPRAAFRPFYSTKPEGTGLGLSIVHDLVRAHRGEVAAFNHEAGGACIQIRLPLNEEPCTA